MKEVYEYKGITKDDAIKKAEEDLQIDQEAFIVECEEKTANKTMYSILDKNNVVLKITVDEDKIYKNKFSLEDLELSKSNIIEFLNQIKEKYKDINFEYEIKTNGRRIYVDINNDENSKWIGHNGVTLEAIQNLLNAVSQRTFKRRTNIRVYVNIGNYKQEKKDRLIRLSDKACQTALKQGISVTMDPMNSYERRIVHTYLQNKKNIKTESFGVGQERHIVVSPALEELK